MAKGEEKQAEKTPLTGKVAQIVLSCAGTLLALLLLFVNTITLEMLCYVFSGMLITVGIFGIVGFFLKGNSLRLQEYGFTGGVLLVLLGVIGMLRTAQSTETFVLLLGVGALILGVMILQSTLELKALNSRYWIANLVLAVLSLGVEFFWLSNIGLLREAFHGKFIFCAVLLTALMSFASMVLNRLGKKEGPQEKKAKDKTEKAVRKQGRAWKLPWQKTAKQGPEDSAAATAGEPSAYGDVLDAINGDGASEGQDLRVESQF